MKYQDETTFEKANVFGKGVPNDAFAQHVGRVAHDDRAQAMGVCQKLEVVACRTGGSATRSKFVGNESR